MSIEEIEEQWKNQPRKHMSEQQAREWVQKNSLSDRFKWGALWVGLLISIVHL
jgi:hypothetical protein